MYGVAPPPQPPHNGAHKGDTTPHTKSFDAGGDLLSHTLPSAVPSAQVDLASGFGMGPGVTPPLTPPTNIRQHPTTHGWAVSCQTLNNEREHTHHTEKHVLLFGLLVPVTSTHYCASRSGLSTPSSTGDLKRNLILEQASRLDAFSGYPFRT